MLEILEQFYVEIIMVGNLFKLQEIINQQMNQKNKELYKLVEEYHVKKVYYKFLI